MLRRHSTVPALFRYRDIIAKSMFGCCYVVVCSLARSGLFLPFSADIDASTTAPCRLMTMVVEEKGDVLSLCLSLSLSLSLLRFIY